MQADLNQIQAGRLVPALTRNQEPARLRKVEAMDRAILIEGAGGEHQAECRGVVQSTRLREKAMRRTMIATACILLAAPALAQSVGEKTGINSALGVSPTTEDFVKEVAISDMFEIEASKLAQQKGNAAEKTFASKMVDDHTKTSTELKGLVSGGKVKAELPTAIDSSHQSKLDKLKGASGQDFSSDFDSVQVSAHKDAVSLFERYAKGGDDPKLKDWAGKTLPALQHHLEMAQALDKNRK
jgi:putative membrane protein